MIVVKIENTMIVKYTEASSINLFQVFTEYIIDDIEYKL